MDNTKTDLVEETTLNRKIPGTKNSTRSGRKSALDFRKYTKQIWLAGLGAFSRAEEEGNKLFDSLVKVGEELESKTSDSAEAGSKIAEPSRNPVHEIKDGVEKSIDHSIQNSLSRIGLATTKDIQHLEQLILQLHHKVDVLVKENQILKEQELKKQSES